MSQIEKLIDCYLGERCPDFHPECDTCQAWGEYDRLQSLDAAYKDARASLKTATEYVGTLQDHISKLQEDLAVAAHVINSLRARLEQHGISEEDNTSQQDDEAIPREPPTRTFIDKIRMGEFDTLSFASDIIK